MADTTDSPNDDRTETAKYWDRVADERSSAYYKITYRPTANGDYVNEGGWGCLMPMAIILGILTTLLF